MINQDKTRTSKFFLCLRTVLIRIFLSRVRFNLMNVTLYMRIKGTIIKYCSW